MKLIEVDVRFAVQLEHVPVGVMDVSVPGTLGDTVDPDEAR
jgi:hypothetical protein